MKNVIDQYDIDGNGEIDLFEFLKMMSEKINNKTSDSEYLEAYMEFDKTNDGEI